MNTITIYLVKSDKWDLRRIKNTDFTINSKIDRLFSRENE